MKVIESKISFYIIEDSPRTEGYNTLKYDMDTANRSNHTSWMAVAIRTYCHKSVRNCCTDEVYGGVFVLRLDLLIF